MNKLKFTKNGEGEIIGIDIKEELTEKEFIEHFVQPEISKALAKQKQEIKEMIEGMRKE